MNSTAKGEIAYARYVYANTQKDDTTIRAPVANFWATRSHTLRSEAEDEFRQMCLEFPQFGYDVLSSSCPLSSLVHFINAKCSSGSGRKAQAGKAGEAASYKHAFQLQKASSRHLISLLLGEISIWSPGSVFFLSCKNLLLLYHTFLLCLSSWKVSRYQRNLTLRF